MHGVPRDVDWSFLHAKQLQVLKIGPYQVTLDIAGPCDSKNPRADCFEISFYYDATVSAFRLTTNSHTSSDLPGGRGLVAALVSIVGSHVVNVTTEDDHTLLIQFDNGDDLRLIEIDMPYESFTVHTPRGIVVV